MPTLSFKGKTVIETYHHTVPHHTLEFDRKLSVLDKGQSPSLDGNLIIEGDNLLALKALLPTHAGKVKCIYIDPPYNTGNEGWVYNDNLTQPQFKEWIGKTVGKEGEDFTRHDKWCCMMYPRLSLLKELLRDDGVIFVSIDEIEVRNLVLLMDEVFGYQNRFDHIVWKKSYGGGSKSTHLVNLHEYVLCYAKKKERVPAFALPPSPDLLKYYKYRDEKYEERGPYRTQPLATQSMDERTNLRYGIPYKGKEVWPSKQWQWSKARALEALAKDELVFVETDDGVSVYYKQYLRDEEGEERSAKPYSIIDGIYTQQGTNWIKRIFGDGKAFDFPKPPELIEHLLQFTTNRDDMVLDCTGGSGTTGHAVLRLNASDGGTRRFVLIQQEHDTVEQRKNRTNVCREKTAERVRRVIQGYECDETQKDILLEEKLSLVKLRDSEGLLRRMDEVSELNSEKYDSIQRKCQDGVLQVLGERASRQNVAGLGGTFTYAKLSDKPLFNEYRDFGKELPAYEDIAQYIFYTETSHEFPGTDRRKNKAWDKKAGRIGEFEGRSYYLLYQPNRKHDMALDTKFLADVAAKDANKELVIYCERIAVHKSELRDFQRKTNKRVRTMLVPFELK